MTKTLILLATIITIGSCKNSPDNNKTAEQKDTTSSQTSTPSAIAPVTRDTTSYDLLSKTDTIKYHEGINLVAVIENNHSLYAEVKKGKETSWFFQEKDGKKYEAKVTARTTLPSNPHSPIGLWCSVTICVNIPGWGVRCATVEGPC